MLGRFTRRKDSALRRIAVARLRRERESGVEYANLRVMRALDDTFEAWDAEPTVPGKEPEPREDSAGGDGVTD